MIITTQNLLKKKKTKATVDKMIPTSALYNIGDAISTMSEEGISGVVSWCFVLKNPHTFHATENCNNTSRTRAAIMSLFPGSIKWLIN
jgi:hypothetical protein